MSDSSNLIYREVTSIVGNNECSLKHSYLTMTAVEANYRQSKQKTESRQIEKILTPEVNKNIKICDTILIKLFYLKERNLSDAEISILKKWWKRKKESTSDLMSDINKLYRKHRVTNCFSQIKKKSNKPLIRNKTRW